MKIDSNTNSIHVFRINRPITKNRKQSPIQQQAKGTGNSPNTVCSRTSLSAETKRSICEHHINNPKCTQESLAVKFGCKRTTIAKIIKSKERWLSIDADTATAKRFRQRNSRFPLVENALKLWLQKEQDNLAGVTDQMLRHQARQYAQAYLVEEEFKASSSWISNFKQKYILANGSSKTLPTLDNSPTTTTTTTTEHSIHSAPSPNYDHPSPSTADMNTSCDDEQHVSHSPESITADCDMTDYDMADPDTPDNHHTIQDDDDASDPHNSNSKLETTMTKLNAKKHLEAVLDFYNTQTEGSMSMSANMIKLILQNDFLN